jgi:signal transduction histidine kinase
VPFRAGGDAHAGLYRPPSVWRSRATLLVALLAFTLVLAAVLAYEAHSAARSHRATAERALHDYATFAAWELLANAADHLQPALTAALAPATGTTASTPYDALPSPEILAASAGDVLRCADARGDAARYYFRLDFRDGSFTTAGATPAPRERERAVAMLSRHARTVYRPDWRYAALLAGSGSAERAFVYGVKYALHGAPLAAYGFATCASAFGAPLFGRVMATHVLLPSTLAGGAPNDSLVAVTVFGPAGDTLYRSAEHGPSPFTADATIETVGGLTARAALRPRAIEQLALGAIPSSKLPLLLGLLGLTAGMMVLALLQLRREQELARLRSDFISSVSHELRTPLSQILLFAETLSLGRVRSEEERSGAADVIVQEARRLMQLVENVLHVSRAERRMTRLTPEVISLAPWVREIVESWRPLAGAMDARIRTVLDDRVTARVDRGALRQMLLNLLDNAVKYGPPGQTVTVGLEGAGERIRLWVADEGPGVPPEQRERVWEPFYRLERDVSSATAGSGIGLFVVRELAHLQDGEVSVDVTSAGGARFVIDLPAATSFASTAGSREASTIHATAGIPR